MADISKILTSDDNKSKDGLEMNENIEFYILNESNKYISEAFVNSIFCKYGLNYKIKNLAMFQRAVIHTSYLKLNLLSEKNMKRHYAYIKDKEVDPIEDPTKAIPLQDHSYERLEFLGDSIIRAVLSDYLYNRYTNEDEGFMTRLRTKIEKGESLARLSKAISLNEYIFISKLIEHKGGRYQNVSILEDVFEAFIGALHMEAGYDICKQFIINIIEIEVDFAELLYIEDNYKDMLLQLYHKKKWDDPKYVSLTTSGTDNRKEFTMCVKDNSGENIGIGTGASKKKGEQEAARRALAKLGELYEETDSELDINDDEYEYSDDDSDANDEYEYSDDDPNVDTHEYSDKEYIQI